MTISPIQSGRLSNTLIAERFQSHVQNAQLGLVRLQEQLSTGQRYQIPSEDSAASVRTMVFQRIIERKEQVQVSLTTGRSLLAASEDALRPVSDALNRAKSLLFGGIGDAATSAEKQGLATEAASLVRDVLNSANRQFRDRFLFGGSESKQVPFELINNNEVRYNGDATAIESFFDVDLQFANNVDGSTAFGALTNPVGSDVNPALTLETRLDDLNRGVGITPGSITVTLTDGATTQQERVDLSATETIDDVKTVLENAFAAGPLTLTVDVDPATQSGLRLTPSSGTVAVSDISGATTAQDLGLASTAAATINGTDLNPQITIHTTLASLNAGTGIGVIAGNGLRISNGTNVSTVSIPTAADATIEDLFNAILQEDDDLHLSINENGDGLAISSRFSGVDFSIGENNGQNATLLGIRTLTASSTLAELNLGVGVPVDDGLSLEITRRDASAINVDLSGTTSIQDVLDRINAVDPGVLTASLNSVGNGITIDDTSGAGDLTIEENSISSALGINGTQTAGTPITGSDVNPRQARGVLNVLIGLEHALRDEDDNELNRIAAELDDEIGRFNLVRAELGTRLQRVEHIEVRLADEEINLRESLSIAFDTDLAETITNIATHQATLQATFQTASQSLRLNLFSFL